MYVHNKFCTAYTKEDKNYNIHSHLGLSDHKYNSNSVSPGTHDFVVIRNAMLWHDLIVRTSF